MTAALRSGDNMTVLKDDFALHICDICAIIYLRLKSCNDFSAISGQCSVPFFRQPLLPNPLVAVRCEKANAGTHLLSLSITASAVIFFLCGEK